MNLTDFLEKWGRTLFEAPLAAPSRSEEPPELAEIRLAILDRVRAESYRAGGKKVFPFDRIRVFLRGVQANRAGAFSSRFFRQYLEREVRNGLRDADCHFPETLRVEVETTPQLPKREESWLHVEIASLESARPPEPGRARLAVVEGRATVSELPLNKARINIGRVVDVYRAEGIFRRNDLAFVEDNEINRTVSREHAHITFDPKTGEHRLHNDRWYPLEGAAGGECATWIVRDGMSQAVHRDARGTKLEHGDEIHFGAAVVRFLTD
jgi:hypothetical protein